MKKIFAPAEGTLADWQAVSTRQLASLQQQHHVGEALKQLNLPVDCDRETDRWSVSGTDAAMPQREHSPEDHAPTEFELPTATRPPPSAPSDTAHKNSVYDLSDDDSMPPPPPPPPEDLEAVGVIAAATGAVTDMVASSLRFVGAPLSSLAAKSPLRWGAKTEEEEAEVAATKIQAVHRGRRQRRRK